MTTLEENKNEDIKTEAYFRALWDILLGLGIQDGYCKHYDPLTIEGNIAHSYVFDLWDGGRHHEFETHEQLEKYALEETLGSIRQELKTLLEECVEMGEGLKGNPVHDNEASDENKKHLETYRSALNDYQSKLREKIDNL